MQELINPNEFKKLLIDESTAWTETTTYIWTTEYANNYPRWYEKSGDEAKAIWRIKKIVADSSTWMTEVSYPDGSYWFNFVWDDRENLTYL